MAKLDNFETVKLVQALEGTYSVYYTDDNGDVEYICTAQTHSMAGGLATVLYNVNQELGCLVY